MNMIWHNHIMIYRNRRIMFWNILYAPLRDYPKVGQGNIFRAINDRPYETDRETILDKSPASPVALCVAGGLEVGDTIMKS